MQWINYHQVCISSDDFELDMDTNYLSNEIDFNQEYSKGLMAPLCIDLKELPTPEILHSRMTSIALENGLLGGIGEDVVNVMLFAAEVILLYWFMKNFFAN